MKDLRRAEIVTIVPIKQDGARSRAFRAVVLDLHYDDPRRAVVIQSGSYTRQVVWMSEIQHDDQPTFAKYPSAGLTLPMREGPT